MHWLDGLAILLILGAGASFILGEGALARSDDLAALYWLAIGVATLHSAVQIARPGART